MSLHAGFCLTSQSRHTVPNVCSAAAAPEARCSARLCTGLRPARSLAFTQSRAPRAASKLISGYGPGEKDFSSPLKRYLTRHTAVPALVRVRNKPPPSDSFLPGVALPEKALTFASESLFIARPTLPP